ncbi:MAG: ROK family protein [Acidimicrobiales bacterium]
MASRGAEDFVLAIDFGGTKTAAAIVTLDGRLLRCQRTETDPARGAHAAVERGLRIGRDLLERARGDGWRCLAAGVVSPGVIRPDGVLLAPNLPGWDRLTLTGLVREGLPVERVAVGNDVKAAGAAEALWGALADASPAVYLNLGTGIGTALLIDGQIVHGAHGAAGELGYARRPQANASTPVLEELVGGRALGRRASALLGRTVSAAEAFEATELALVDLVDGALDELATHIANLCLGVDPALVAVGGGLMGSAPRIVASLSRRLSLLPFPPPLVRARFLRDASLYGAAALALRWSDGSRQWLDRSGVSS